MNIVFLNGTDQQQGVFRAAMRGLLHLDLDAIPGSIDVSFVPDPEPTTVNEFAFAQATSGSTGEIKMRDDFPDFAPRALWGSNEFARETVIHEFGHILLGWLPPAPQEAIAAMFGTVPSQWNPQDKLWVDRPLEGIVETFKDAFLPARLRQHFNRTNHKIPLRKYPEFRRHFRQPAFEAEHPEPEPPAPADFEWTIRSAPSQFWWAATYGGGLFVVVANQITGTTRVMTSPDGINWTSHSGFPSNRAWVDVAYGDGRFVAVASTGNSPNIMSSPDGINWTLSPHFTASGHPLRAVAHGNGLWVVTDGPHRVVLSSDGINWTNVLKSNWQSSEIVDMGALVYGDGLFVGVFQIGTLRVQTSPDGTNWTLHESPLRGWIDITYGAGLFVALAANLGAAEHQGPGVMTSPDGVNWTLRSIPDELNWRGITYANGLFVAVANTGSGNRSMISPNGIDWTLVPTPANNDWQSVTFGEGRFVAVASTGAGNRVMTGEGGEPGFPGWAVPEPPDGEVGAVGARSGYIPALHRIGA